ncbi:MAG: AI-2E family transporter [Magnetospirillum sp.]|nr:AI-2E family transporter [Magnetospirillum sp.]
MEDASSLPPRSRASAPLSLLAGLAVLAVLHVAAEVVLPLLVAALLAVVLGRPAAWLRRRGIPKGLAAALMTAAVAGAIGAAITLLAEPAGAWIHRAPQSVGEIERKLLPVRGPVEEVRRATERVERLAGGEQAPRVKVEGGGLGASVLTGAGTLAAQALVTMFLLFFLLANAPGLTRALLRVPRSRAGRRRAAAIVRRIDSEIGSYVGVFSLVNLGLAAVTALVMAVLGMPNPVLWGMVAGLLNFFPYAGPAVTAVILAAVGVLTFDTVGRGLLPAAAYLALTTVESDLVTPMLVGRTLTLPPVMVFLSLMLWGWLWGVAGVLLAVPLLVMLKVAAGHIEALAPLAPFLDGGSRHKLPQSGKGMRP